MNKARIHPHCIDPQAIPAVSQAPREGSWRCDTSLYRKGKKEIKGPIGKCGEPYKECDIHVICNKCSVHIGHIITCITYNASH